MQQVIDIFRMGGPVMWPLLATSLAIWFLMLWWGWQLHFEVASMGKLADAVLDRFDEGGRDACLTLLARRRGFFAAALNRFFSRAQPFRSPGDFQAMFLAVEGRMSGHGRYLEALIKVSPLLGLLGTICGMVATFQALQAFGVADPKALSAGISAALLTTQAGLMIALPGIFGHDWLVKVNTRGLAALHKARRTLARTVERAG